MMMMSAAEMEAFDAGINGTIFSRVGPVFEVIGGVSIGILLY
jgi:hypothetical protein